MKKILFLLLTFIVQYNVQAQCPIDFHMSDTLYYCSTGGPTLVLSGSQTGVRYDLRYASSTFISSMYGTGSSLDFGRVTDGRYIVTATDTTSHCTRTMPDTVYAFKGYFDSPTYNRDTICNHTSTFLYGSGGYGTWSTSDSSRGFVSYDWSTSSYSSFQVQSGRPGTVNIFHVIPSTCPNNVDTFSIFVDSVAIPTISGPSTLCIGMTGAFHSSFFTGYDWHSSDPAVISIDYTGAIAALSPGTSYIGDTLVSRGCYFYISQRVDVLPVDRSLILGPSLLPYGSTFLYTARTSSAVWSSSVPSVVTISSTGSATSVDLGYTNLLAISSTSCDEKYVVSAPARAYFTDSFAVDLISYCDSVQFRIYNSILDTNLYLTSYFGDGTSNRISLMGVRFVVPDSTSHIYLHGGSYSVKHILSRGTSPIDSIIYTYNFVPCSSTLLRFFVDADSNCSKGSSEVDNLVTIGIAIDSAGIPIDTVRCLSGVIFPKYGPVGTVYHYRILSNPYLRIGCPSSGIISDTVHSSSSSTTTLIVPLKPIGPLFDLQTSGCFRTGRHEYTADLNVSNSMLFHRSGTLTLKRDTAYRFYEASPSPASYTDSTVTWNFSNASVDSSIFHFYFRGEVRGGTSAWLTPGNLVHSSVVVTPTTGDYDTSNNVIIRDDTVKASWDPNTCTVQPDGDIFDGTTLHYTIGFENTGNDTARNIHIMDTLSDFLDVSSLVVESASSTMNISYLRAGGHNIIKFDFPHINLPDTSHHGLADGFVIFHIKPNSSLSDRTDIYNRAGIYFDENDVVLTNYAHNRIINPSVTITRTIDTICHGGTNRFVAAPHTTGVQHYRWRVNSTFFAHDSAEFTHTGFSGGDTITCYMTTVLGDSSREVTSNSIYIIERSLVAGSITGSPYACVGASSSYTPSFTGGTFTVTNTRASITSSGVLTAHTVGADTIVYTVTNVCGSVSTTRPVTIYTAPDTNVITGVNHMCQGGSITLHDTGASGIWSVTNSRATNAGPVYTGVAPGLDTALYTVTNYCGTRVSRFVFTVDSLLASSVNITVTPNDTLCSGTSATFVATSVNGGASPAYYWFNYSTSVGTGPTYTYTPATSDEIRCMMLTSVACPSNDTAISDSIRMMVNITVTPIDTITSSASGDSITYLGQLVNFTSTATYCGSGTTYQWYVNGRPVAGATNYNYTSTFYSDSSIYCVIHCNAPCQSRPYDTSNVIIIHGEYLNHLSVTSVSNPNSNIALFPNPNTGEFMVSCITDVTDDMPYEVVDIAGRVVSRGALHPVNGVVRQQISGGGDHDLQPGQYVMRVVSPMGVNIMYFTVQR